MYVPASSYFVILSKVKDLVFSRIYDILQSRRSLSMTGEAFLQRF
jgi:hypothetical protein